MDNKENKLLNLQLLTTTIYIGSLLLSILLTYNDIKSNNKENTPLTNKQAANLSIFNRTLVVILTFIYLYINYKTRDNAKKNNQKIWPFNLQVCASELSMLATIIVLYVVIETSGEQYSIVPGINNPSL